MTISDPEALFVPDQLPDAVHEVAFVEDQVRVSNEPAATDAALEVSVTVGAVLPPSLEVTETEAVWLVVPPAPEQLSVYEAAALNAPTASDPEVAFAPDQLPDAVHVVALVEDQVSVTEEPETTEEALGVNVTVGAVPAGVVLTATEAVWLTEPPAPEQLNVYDAVALNGPTVSEPEVAFVPVQPPDAVHEVASVEDQFNVTDELVTTEAALAVSVTVGAAADDAGAGLLPSLPLPPPPPQPANKKLARKPGNDRTAIWCFTTPLPRCTGAGPPRRSASVRE